MSVQLRRGGQDFARLTQLNHQSEERLDQLKAELSGLADRFQAVTERFHAVTEEKEALRVRVEELLSREEYRKKVFEILKEQVVEVRAMEQRAIEQRNQLIITENWNVLRVGGALSAGVMAGAFVFGPIGAVVGMGVGLVFGTGASYYAASDQSNARAALINLIKRAQEERAMVVRSFVEQGFPAPQFEDEGRYNPPSPQASISDR